MTAKWQTSSPGNSHQTSSSAPSFREPSASQIAPWKGNRSPSLIRCTRARSHTAISQRRLSQYGQAKKHPGRRRPLHSRGAGRKARESPTDLIGDGSRHLRAPEAVDQNLGAHRDGSSENAVASRFPIEREALPSQRVLERCLQHASFQFKGHGWVDEFIH